MVNSIYPGDEEKLYRLGRKGMSWTCLFYGHNFRRDYSVPGVLRLRCLDCPKITPGINVSNLNEDEKTTHIRVKPTLLMEAQEPEIEGE